MNGGTLAILLPTALAVSVSPAPLIELILVVFSKRRVANMLAFVVVLLAGTAAALAIGAAGQAAAGSSGGGTSSGTGIVLAVFGLLLLVLGVQNWRNRRDTSEPAMFAKISGMGPAAAGFLAFGAVFVNPKNLVLLIAAGQQLNASDADAKLLVGAIFIVVATLPYLAVTAYALFGGERANATLDRARAWLVARNRLIMGVLCTALGLVLLVKGIGAL